MLLRVVTPPDPIFTVDDLGLADDDASNLALKAAIQFLDGPLGFMGASLGLQTLELMLPSWYSLFETVLPCGPVIGLESIKYLDGAGVEQTVAGANYRLIRGTLGDVVYLNPSFDIPDYSMGPDAIRIRYTAGHDGETTPELPEVVKQAVGMLASQNLSTGKMAAGSALKSVEIPGVLTRTYDTSGAASAGQQGVVNSTLMNLLTGHIRRGMI